MPTATPEVRDGRETADVSAQRIARVYAEALYAAAAKKGQADAVLGELESLVNEVFGADARVAVFLSGAAVGRDARRTALANAFQGRVSDEFYSFLQVLNSHERLELIRPVARAYRELADQKANRLRVLVTTAVPMPDDLRRKLEHELRAHTGKEPVLIAAVDPTLLGGLKLRIGDVQYDGTVKTRIENLRTQILARSSHEIQSRRDRIRTADGDRAV